MYSKDLPPQSQCRILGEKISRSTRLDDVSQLEVVLSCSGAGPSYMPHKVAQCGARKGQGEGHPEWKLLRVSLASMRASLGVT